MHLIRNVYYWASDGCVEAVPAGIIAVNCGDEICPDCDVNEISGMLSSWGVFDDTCWQLNFQMDDVDLIRKDDGKYVRYLARDQIVPDWQWNQIKNQSNMRVHEVDFLELVRGSEEFAAEDDA